MTPWTRGLFCGHSVCLGCTQQLGAFCSFAFILPKSKRFPILQPHTDQLSCTRHYNSRRESTTKDALPLYRSKTAYYDILKVTPNATQAQIKTAYYKQSFIYHPDKNPGSTDATQAFSEISEAYTVLGNITLRRKYDQGILSESNVRGVGNPSSTDSTSKATKQQQRSREFTQRGGRPFYDFDAFYKAHYGDQLQKEQQLRAMRQRMREMHERKMQERERTALFDMFAILLFLSAGCILYTLSGS